MCRHATPWEAHADGTVSCCRMRLGIDARLVARGLGIAQFVRQLASHLDPSVEIVWFGNPRDAPPRAAEVRPMDRLPYPALDTRVGRAAARQAGLDVMHFTGNTGWRQPESPPFVLTVHDLIFMDTPLAGRSLRQAVGHRYLRSNVAKSVHAADEVACDSAVSAKAVLEHLRPARAPTVVPLGVDLEFGSDAAGQVAGVERPPYAVTFSARDPRKGAELAYRGWSEAASGPVRLVVLAGAGVPEGFEAAVGPAVAEGNVEVLPYLPRDELRGVLQGASVLIHASSAEGFGLPILEAMAAGVPVISGLAATSEEFAPEAFLPIDPGAPAPSIARALTRLQEDPRLREDLVERARAQVASLTWEATADRYLALYRQALVG